MRNLLLATACIVLLGGGEVFGGRFRPLANEGKRGLGIRYIDHALQLRPEEVDLGTALLTVSDEWSEDVDTRRYIEMLDEMAFDIRERMDEEQIGPDARAVKIINDYLFDELKFKPVAAATDPNDLFLHTVLVRKKGYCLSLSVLYLSIGERLGLPLKGVVVPGHFFVRYNDGRVKFNIETTNKGLSASDDYYVEQYEVPDYEGSIYMTELNPLQTLGCFFNNLGNSYVDIGDREAALMAFARAVEVTPLLGEARTNLGNLYLRMGQLRDAISEYMAALEINERDAKTRNNLGNAYTSQGRLSQAVNEYLYALEIDNNYVDAYRNLAIAYTRQKKYTMAAMQLKRALYSDPENADIYSQLGDVLSRAGDYSAAEKQFNKAIKLDRGLASAYFGLAICYNRAGEPDREIKTYKKALTLDPNMGAAWANLGNAYFAKGRFETAVEYYRRAVELRGDASVYYNLGSAYLRTEEFAFAVAAFTSALGLNQNMADAHHGLAYCYYRLGQYEQAWVHVVRAQELGVDVPAEEIEAIKQGLKRQ